MGRSCSVPPCCAGYRKKKNEQDIHKTSVFSFPDKVKNSDMYEKWIRAIPRKDWSPTTWSGVCALHFKEDDFVSDREDTNKRRKKKKSTLVLNVLKSDAVPSIFPQFAIIPIK